VRHGRIKIGDLARHTGVSTRLLRYYEERGLLTAHRGENDYREYDESAVEKVRLIRELLESGLTTELVRAGIPCRLNPPAPGQELPCATRETVEKLREQARNIEQRLAALGRTHVAVSDYLRRAEAAVRAGGRVPPDFPQDLPPGDDLTLPLVTTESLEDISYRKSPLMNIGSIHTIGIIGAGNVGKQIARLAAASGHHVLLSNSRGPETLPFDIIHELADRLTKSTADEVIEKSDLVVIAIPVGAYTRIPAMPEGKILIDAGNYYPARDGVIPALESGGITSSQLLQEQLPGARVVKAFNHIRSAELTTDATRPGTPDRRAMIVAGDDRAARATAAELMDNFGFDPLDIGELREGWRVQPGTPAYVGSFTREQLVEALNRATR
jgi:predicted dinucleotide-binding enzyme/DNA-binding transcriptional MerR regulator